MSNAVSRTSLRRCGETVEALLEQHSVALTMGGEPTFVPIQPEGAEWATAAFGPTKLDYARRLALQLIRDTHPGAVVLETSGKHYPGEPLPRWTVLIQRRSDGKPLWHQPKILRGDTTPQRHRFPQARVVIQMLAGKLGIPPARVQTLRCQGKAAGYVLPLDYTEEQWVSDDWSLDFEGPIELFPGEGFAGLRLPLGKLKSSRLKRALTVELRQGGISVFVPPLLTEPYQELLAHIEAVFAERRLKGCTLSGYAPPADPALPTIGLASDPGVLEINLAPCTDWQAYDQQIQEIYAAARKVGLTARKFHFNGRETGTGGGAHLVFGGPDGLYSPFFAFPHFLPSVIRYFQHHPGLSFAFTGSYMGPSSQAPRIDESTFEALYELEIACAGAEKLGHPPNLPQFDLLFRDLLMDRSGNTHRAEISVDKLYNPFSPNGRLGLVEFRAFESHPDATTMSMIGLFVRAIMARLVADPVAGPFARWAGELHDHFLLPSFIWQDLQTICADLQQHGLPFEEAWLKPFWEWRFPALGRFELTYRDEQRHLRAAHVEFRQALEAWPLLGESPNAGTVARTVDSSMDRIEVAVSDPQLLERGLLLANGYPCEFRVAGETAAAGIRYRAFQLSPALHPHIPVHAPLLLEWVDRATLSVVAAARWHVWNPSSKPYRSRPKSAATALKRMTGRWEPWPQTEGQSRWIPQIDFPPEGRHTLDLRRYPAQARG